LSGRHAHFRLALEEADPIVRTWRQGDRIALPGLDGHKKLSDLFIDRKVPRAERTGIPLVVASDGSIAWVTGLAVGEPWRATGDEEFVLCCTIEPTRGG
jgi:tRNA(Ile)-lysidine synthetase-like protein